jgi:hypothetical protein
MTIAVIGQTNAGGGVEVEVEVAIVAGCVFMRTGLITKIWNSNFST